MEEFIGEGVEDHGMDTPTLTPQELIGMEQKAVAILREVGCGVKHLKTLRLSESMILAALEG